MIVFGGCATIKNILVYMLIVRCAFECSLNVEGRKCISYVCVRGGVNVNVTYVN